MGEVNKMAEVVQIVEIEVVQIVEICSKTGIKCTNCSWVLLDNRQSIEQQPDSGYCQISSVTTNGKVYSADEAEFLARCTGQTMIQVSRYDGYDSSTGKLCYGYFEKP